MPSQITDAINDHLTRTMRLREDLCRQAWLLTHPSYRDRLIQVIDSRLDYDWALACLSVSPPSVPT